VGFAISAKAYRYGDHGIFLTTKEYRHRIFVELTDGHRYTCQLYIKLYPESNKLEIKVPVEVKVKAPPQSGSIINIKVDTQAMFITSTGHMYGEELGRMEKEEGARVREYQSRHAKLRKQSIPNTQNTRNIPSYIARERQISNIRQNNLGVQKYNRSRARYVGKAITYINQEINRLLETEQPKSINITNIQSTT
jgi:hypothetical protein